LALTSGSTADLMHQQMKRGGKESAGVGDEAA
jgi:hypothetical protein